MRVEVHTYDDEARGDRKFVWSGVESNAERKLQGFLESGRRRFGQTDAEKAADAPRPATITITVGLTAGRRDLSDRADRLMDQIRSFGWVEAVSAQAAQAVQEEDPGPSFDPPRCKCTAQGGSVYSSGCPVHDPYEKSRR